MVKRKNTSSSAVNMNTNNKDDLSYASMSDRSMLSPLKDIDDEHMATLRTKMINSAINDNLIDIAYCTIDSPIGELLIAASDEGVLRVAFLAERFDSVLQEIAANVSTRILRVPQRLDFARRQLDEYFSGSRTVFDLPLDMRLSKGFRLSVLHTLSTIEYGQTKSYSQVAEVVGNPKAVRAVGTACATNPIPIIIPCHRVLRSDGTLGGYLGGLDMKRSLLRLEGVD